MNQNIENYGCGFCYVFLALSAYAMLHFHPNSDRIKFHAYQSMLLNAVILIYIGGFGFVYSVFPESYIGKVAGVMLLIVNAVVAWNWILAITYAARGNDYRILVIGSYAKKYSDLP